MGKLISDELKLHFHEISAKSGKGVKELFERIAYTLHGNKQKIQHNFNENKQKSIKPS